MGNFWLLYLSFGFDFFLFFLNDSSHIPNLILEFRELFGYFIDIGHIGLDPQIGNESANAFFELFNIFFFGLEGGFGKVIADLYDLADCLLTIVLLHMNPD